jgi:hypothetical protein
VISVSSDTSIHSLAAVQGLVGAVNYFAGTGDFDLVGIRTFFSSGE